MEGYRSRYREQQIPGWYRGWVHFIAVMGSALGIALVALWHLQAPSVWELALFPSGFVFANLVEYLGHRFPMHRPVPGFRFILSRHAGMHHRYYTHESMQVDDERDFATVLFPPQAFLLFFGVVAVPVAAGLAWLSWNASMAFVAVTTLYYVVYECLHLAYHLDPEGVIGRLPGMASLRAAHTHHHDPAVMHNVNFNISFPLMDLLFGTYGSRETRRRPHRPVWLDRH